MSGPIDTTGARPKLALGALFGSSAGLAAFAYFHAIMAWIDGIGDGINDSLQGFSTFAYGDGGVIGLLFDGVIGAMGAAWSSYGAWLASTFGVFAQVVAILSIMAVIYAILVGLQRGAQRVREGLA